MIFLVSGAVDEGFIEVEYHQVFEAWFLELEIQFVVIGDFLVLIDIEFTFEPGDLFVDFVGKLIVLWQLKRLLNKPL